MRTVRITNIIFLGVFLLNTSAYAIDTIKISIQAEDFYKLDSIRKKTFQLGIIKPEDKQKFPAKLNFDGEETKAKIRLKGDWTDHMDSEKWSFRIELENGFYHGMRKFSIQHPKTRGYFFEFMFHKLLEEEGVMTTKYDFAHIKINGTYKGIYAIEEHFDDNLIQRYGREKSVIIKFNETAFWEFQEYLKLNGEDISIHYPMLNEAEIDPFGKKNVWNDTVLRARFLAARNLLNSLRSFTNVELAEIIDIDQFAKYYALSCLFSKQHGLAWHNQRFYFNPTINKLEPVAYDCWSAKAYHLNYNTAIVKEGVDTVYFAHVHFNAQLFNNLSFREKYEGYMRQYLQNDYLLGKARKIITDSEEIYRELQSEYRYKMTSDYFNLTQSLLDVKTKFKDGLKTTNFVYYPIDKWYKDHPDLAKQYVPILPDIPFYGLGLKAYTMTKDKAFKSVQLRNVYRTEITLIEAIGEETIELEGVLSSRNEENSCLVLSLPNDVFRIKYRTGTNQEIFDVEISNYPDFKLCNP